MIRIVEVGPRDGLQNEKSILSTDDKFEFIRLLSETGLKTIETTSFVKAPAIPQMADAHDLYTRVRDQLGKSGVSYPCLVPNMHGLNDALTLGVKEIALFSATSDTFAKKNVNATVAETFDRMRPVAQEAKKNGLRVRAYVSTAYGCPYEGNIALSKLVKVIEDFMAMDVYEISIGDTTGIATPRQVEESLKVLVPQFGVSKLAMHFHDTRGMALTNILKSIEAGITTFDASAGGLGGCPYAKGATGNVATEDVWYLCHSLGLKTGVDLDKLVAASSFILKKVGKDTASKFLRAYLNTGVV
jgi:hydroxymethylglutaryl-CoA lyase